MVVRYYPFSFPVYVQGLAGIMQGLSLKESAIMDSDGFYSTSLRQAYPTTLTIEERNAPFTAIGIGLSWVFENGLFFGFEENIGSRNHTEYNINYYPDIRSIMSFPVSPEYFLYRKEYFRFQYTPSDIGWIGLFYVGVSI